MNNISCLGADAYWTFHGMTVVPPGAFVNFTWQSAIHIQNISFHGHARVFSNISTIVQAMQWLWLKWITIF